MDIKDAIAFGQYSGHESPQRILADKIIELEREIARLQMELDASCNAEELRQVRAENARLRASNGVGSSDWLGGMSFIQVIRLLWDTKGWHYGPCPRWFPDEITYRDTGLRFYLDQNCTRLRLGRVVVYDAGLFAWLVFGVLCLRLRFYLPNA